jgi:hypothetical protein
MPEQISDNEGEKDDNTLLPIQLQQSVCSRCIEKRIVRTGKGSVFLLCQLGISNPSWPKYPPQPVRRCPKFCAE